MPKLQTEQEDVPSLRRNRLSRALVWGGIAGLLLAIGGEAVRVTVGPNLHIVLPGRIYRCAQPTPQMLTKLVQRFGIRTVVNLRGCCVPYSRYMDEARSTHDLNISQEDICLSAYRLPSASEMRRLVEVLDRSEHPILLHCRRGADRTGLVAAVCQLLYTDTDLAGARRQMGPRFGHVAMGHTANLDLFVQQYEDWLRQTGQVHSPAELRRWILQEYRGSPWNCRIELLEMPGVVHRNEPWSLRIRVHNTSGMAWRLSATNTAGVHAAYTLTGASGQNLAQGRAALFRGEVLPEQSLDVTLDLPAVAHPGPWFLTVDMHHDQNGWFHQFGSEPLQIRIPAL